MPAPEITPFSVIPQRTMAPAVFVPATNQWMAELNPWGEQVQAVGEYIDGVAQDLDSKISLAGFGGTSTTSVAIGVGLKSWVTQPGLAYVQGSFIKGRADATHWVWGEVNDYDVATGDLDVTVQATSLLTGTFANWTFSLAEPIGFRPEPADVAEIRAGVNVSDFVTIGDEFSALAEVALTDASTIAVDMSTFYNANVSLGANRTLGNPTFSAGFVRKKGCIRIAPNGHTLAFSSNWKRAGGAPDVSAVTEGFIYFDAVSSTKIVYQFVRDPSS